MKLKLKLAQPQTEMELELGLSLAKYVNPTQNMIKKNRIKLVQFVLL